VRPTNTSRVTSESSLKIKKIVFDEENLMEPLQHTPSKDIQIAGSERFFISFEQEAAVKSFL
jgi:hypothetical protein